MRGLPETVVAPWAERLAFTHLLGTRLPDLSKGSAHKVGLAQALLPGPGFLILDEPFAGLDAETRAALPSLLAELAGGGTTVVVSAFPGVALHLAVWSALAGALYVLFRRTSS